MDGKDIFIVGANGQLGQALQAKYPAAKKADVAELDITKSESVAGYDWSGTKVLINAAAYTNVDGAETPEGRIAAWNVNATAVSYLAEVCRQKNMTLVHISTDYVFDGAQDNHTEQEPLSPLGVYGASKAAGDIAAASAPNHYILRTSWVIGAGKNFVRTMLEVGRKGIAPSVVNDQVGRLTFTSQLVEAIDFLLENKAEFGTYNVSNGGEAASWADITREIFRVAGFFKLEVTNTSTEEYFSSKPEAAPRPLNSTLDLTKIIALGFQPRDWRLDLEDYVKKELSR